MFSKISSLRDSLQRRRNLTSVSNVWLNELPKVRFVFPFILIGELTKSWYTGGGPEQEFRRCFGDRLNQSLVLSVVQSTLWKAFLKRCAFGDRFYWIRVDGRSNWKLSVFKQKRIRVDGTLDRPHLSGICTLCVYLVEHLFPRMMDDCLSMAWPTPCHWNLSLSLLDYCLSYPRLKLFEKTKILIKRWWLSQPFVRVSVVFYANRLFTVPYFSVRLSTSSALRYRRQSWMQWVPNKGAEDGLGGGVSRLPPPTAINPVPRPLGTQETMMAVRTGKHSYEKIGDCERSSMPITWISLALLGHTMITYHPLISDEVGNDSDQVMVYS